MGRQQVANAFVHQTIIFLYIYSSLQGSHRNLSSYRQARTLVAKVLAKDLHVGIPTLDRGLGVIDHRILLGCKLERVLGDRHAVLLVDRPRGPLAPVPVLYTRVWSDWVERPKVQNLSFHCDPDR